MQQILQEQLFGDGEEVRAVVQLLKSTKKKTHAPKEEILCVTCRFSFILHFLLIFLKIIQKEDSESVYKVYNMFMVHILSKRRGN